MSASYDDVSRRGTVTFDLTAAADAPVGDLPVRVFFGRELCETTGSVISVCEELPLEIEGATHTTCGSSGAQSVLLDVPDIERSCIRDATISGVVVSSNGVPLSPPVAIAGNGEVALAVGVHVVEWTVEDDTVSQVAQQTIQVLPGLAAEGRFDARDRARVLTGTGAFAAVANLGSTSTELGVQAHLGDVVSVASVLLRDGTTVHGSLTTAGALTRQNQTTVTGTIQEQAELALGNLANPPVDFPSDMGPGLTLETDATQGLPPGTYGPVHVQSRASLVLAAGDYVLESLSVEPDATIVVASGTRLFVRDALTYRGRFVDDAGVVTPTFLAYYGTSSVTLEREFRGKLFAESASLALGAGQRLSFAGQFFAKDIEVRPDVTVTCSTELGAVHALDLSTPPLGAPREDSDLASDNVNQDAASCSVGRLAAGNGIAGTLWIGALAVVEMVRRRRWRDASRRSPAQRCVKSAEAPDVRSVAEGKILLRPGRPRRRPHGDGAGPRSYLRGACAGSSPPNCWCMRSWGPALRRLPAA